MNPFVCRHCEKDLPENYNGRYCPNCGAVLPEVLIPVTGVMNVPKPTPSVAEEPPSRYKINWWIFFAALLAPPLLTLLVAFLGSGNSNEQVSPMIAFFGGAAGGIASGIMLALRLGRTTGTRILLGILFSAGFAIVCVTLSCFGCLAGGYRLDLR